MIEKTGAIDVYFEKGIEILVAEPDTFPVDAAKEVLKSSEVEFSEIEKSAPR